MPELDLGDRPATFNPKIAESEQTYFVSKS
jgi:hypothetical protein